MRTFRGTNKSLIEAIVHGIEDAAPQLDRKMKVQMVANIRRELMDFINNKLNAMGWKIEELNSHMPSISEAIFGSKKEEL